MITLFITISIISLLMLIVSFIAIPYFVVTIPADYFDNSRIQWQVASNWKQRCITIMKNIIGYILLLAGIIMLVTPGQGIITILMSIILIDFPNKRYWENRLIELPGVLKVLNWMREKKGVEPLIVPSTATLRS